MDSDPLDLELATAALLADDHDVRWLLDLLASQLEGPLGRKVSVERAGGLLRRSKEVRRITVRFGDDEFSATAGDNGVSCTVGHSSGGIRIRTEKVTLAEWLGRLLEAVRAEAATNQSARTALERIVMGGAV